MTTITKISLLITRALPLLTLRMRKTQAGLTLRITALTLHLCFTTESGSACIWVGAGLILWGWNKAGPLQEGSVPRERGCRRAGSCRASQHSAIRRVLQAEGVWKKAACTTMFP